MLVVTTDLIPNAAILETKGAVCSERVAAINAAKDAINWVKGLWGGQSDAYSEEYRKARQQALQDLQSQAAALGADAIMDLKLHYDQFLNSEIIMVVVTASGTAVTTGPAQ